jgi:hypothetical protein
MLQVGNFLALSFLLKLRTALSLDGIILTGMNKEEHSGNPTYQ